MNHTGRCLLLGDFYQHIFQHLWDFFLGIPDRQLNLGHWSYFVQMSKMVGLGRMMPYLNTLNIMKILELWSIFEDKRANLMQQNRPVPLDILLVILLLREQVHHRFELIRIILMAIPEAMNKITQT